MRVPEASAPLWLLPVKTIPGGQIKSAASCRERQELPKVCSLMGKAVGKGEGESKLRDGDMRGAGRKPGKGWKGRQGKERRERKGAGPTAWLSISGKLLFACLTKEEGKEIGGSLCCCEAPQVQ